MTPLPDATPDQRIYKLLKTTDLENLTFADFQKVAQTIYAEQGAEDELRRIVLVNLARLAVAGEWTGLTTAGGGGAPEIGYKTGYYYQPAPMIWGNTSITTYDADKIYLYLMYINKDVTLDRLAVFPFSGGAVGSVRVGVYNMGSNGLPSTLKFEAGTYTTGGTSAEEFTINQAFDQGYYWIAFQGAVTPVLRRENDTEGRGMYGITGFGSSLQYYNELGLYYAEGYSGGFIDLSSSNPSGADSQQIVSAMRVA